MYLQDVARDSVSLVRLDADGHICKDLGLLLYVDGGIIPFGVDGRQRRLAVVGSEGRCVWFCGCRTGIHKNCA